MVAGRVYVNPQDKVRVYIPLGIGLAHTAVRVSDGYGYKVSSNDDTLGLYGGVGAEVSVNENVIFGLEWRFNHAKYNEPIDDARVKAKVQHMDVMARIGYKF